MYYLKHLTLLIATLSVSSLVFAGNQCHDGQWYSQKYNKCFNKNGYCKQYDGTDTKTCNTAKDNLKCDWDHNYETCYPEEGHNQCPQGYWYSDKFDKCFKKHGKCKQYNHTDYNTCNTPKDNLRCDWDHHNETCYPE